MSTYDAPRLDDLPVDPLDPQQEPRDQAAEGPEPTRDRFAGWKDAAAAVAPALATAFLGPAAGLLTKVIAERVTGRQDATDAEINAAMLDRNGRIRPGMDATIAVANLAYQQRLAELANERLRMQSQERVEFMHDTQDARKMHAAEERANISLLVLGQFAIVTALTLAGIYGVVTGGIANIDAGTVAAVFTLLGALIRDVTASAQQIIGFYFGSSQGSADKAQDLRQAVERIGGVRK